MDFLAHLLYPGKHNNYHPHATRIPFLIAILIFLAGFSVINSLFFSTQPKILGFATNIYTNEVIELTNKERTKAGLNPVKENSVLDKIAAEKGQNMFANNYWAHVSPDGTTPWYFFQRNEYHYLYAGENLARDFYTSSAVVAAWMASPSHKENLMSPDYQEIGVAVLNGAFDGKDTTLVVQMFGTPLSSSIQLAKSNSEPKTAGFYVSNEPSRSISSLPIDTLGTTQKVYLWFSIALMGLFLFDSVILIRNGIRHRERHPYFHMVLLGLIVFLIIYLNKGMVV